MRTLAFIHASNPSAPNIADQGSTAANYRSVFQGNVLDAAPAFQVVAPRMVNQNPPHELRRNGEEVGAVLPAHALVVHQPQVSFVDQGRGL